jgi:hypothetical protein
VSAIAPRLELNPLKGKPIGVSPMRERIEPSSAAKLPP